MCEIDLSEQDKNWDRLLSNAGMDRLIQEVLIYAMHSITWFRKRGVIINGKVHRCRWKRNYDKVGYPTPEDLEMLLEFFNSGAFIKTCDSAGVRLPQHKVHRLIYGKL